MKILEFLKANLRESLLKGIEETIDSLKELLPKNSDKYQSLILIQSQLLEVKRKVMHGTISEADAQLAKNRLRESLMELINSLEKADVEPSEKEPQAKATAAPPPPKTSTKAPAEKVQPAKKRAAKKTTTNKEADRLNWSAKIVKEDDLDWLEFEVQLSEKHQVVYYLEGTTSLLKVDGKVVFREKVNLLNAVSSIMNFLTVNEEHADFKIQDGDQELPARLSLGVSLKAVYKKIKLSVDGKLLYVR